jgi:MFS family permease
MARSVLLTTSFSAFIVMVGVGIISPLLPLFAEDLGASGVWIGIIFSAYSFSRLVFLPLAGKMGDRYGKKNIISTGLLFYSLISILYVFSRTPEELSAVRLLHGVTSAMIIPIAMAYAAEISPKGKEGYFMGYFNRALFLGMATGPLMGGFISDIVGIRYTFLSLSVLGFFTLILVLLTFPSTSMSRKGIKERGLIKSIRSSMVRLSLFFRFLNSMGRGSILSFLPIYLGIIGFMPSLIGIIISTNLLISALIQPSSGKLTDRIGPFYPVTISTLLGALILFLIPRIENFYFLAILSAMLGITSALNIPAIGAMVAVEGKAHGGMGSLMGTLSASKSLGRIAGPLISGAIYDVFGGGLYGVRMAFSFAAVLTLFSAFVFWAGWMKGGRGEWKEITGSMDSLVD